MQEIWKDFPGYEGRYQVSSKGRVCSLDYMHTGQHRIMTQMLNKKYYQLLLYKDGKSRCWPVHKMVAITFIPNPYGKKCVDHINTITTDNRVENLRWCTHKENSNNPLTKPRMCLNFRRPVLQMDLEGNIIKKWESITAAAKFLGVRHGPISACCRGITTKSEGYKWKYYEQEETN